MRLVAGTIGNRTFWGIRLGDTISDLSQLVVSPNALAAAAMDPESLAVLAANAPVLSAQDVTLLPPIPRPGKILCVGTNYAEHVAESDSVSETPEYPVLFVRFPESLVGADQPIVRPSASSVYDFEGELAVVIGRQIRSVGQQEAVEAIVGFAPFMDGTVRDYQRHTKQFTPGKNFDRSGAWGPEIVTSDEVGDFTDLQLTTTVSGETMQSASTSQLIHKIGRIVSYASEFTTLHPGDVIATGTPGGVGYARNPQRLLQPGDVVEVTIERVGTLTNTVIDE